MGQSRFPPTGNVIPMSQHWRLVRPGLLATILFSMLVAAVTTGQEVPPWTLLAHSLIGTGMVIAGAVAMNQRLEQRSDARMARTAGRPLPARQLTTRQVTSFAVVCSLAGMVYLVVLAPGPVALMAGFSWVLYVLVYTPLKRVTLLQTPVGAVAGAFPILLGAATAEAIAAPMAWALFGVVFFWQFPHTMSIAWIYRQEYAAGGVQVATVVDPSGRLAGRLALVGAACLLPVSLAPWMLSLVGPAFAIAAILSGLAHLAVAARFAWRPGDATARALWRVSLVHLPLLLVALVLDVRW